MIRRTTFFPGLSLIFLRYNYRSKITVGGTCRDSVKYRGFRLPRKRAVQMPWFMITLPRLPWFRLLRRKSVPCKCLDFWLLYRDCRGLGLLRKRAVRMPWSRVTVPWSTVSGFRAEDSLFKGFFSLSPVRKRKTSPAATNNLSTECPLPTAAAACCFFTEWTTAAVQLTSVTDQVEEIHTSFLY